MGKWRWQIVVTVFACLVVLLGVALVARPDTGALTVPALSMPSAADSPSESGVVTDTPPLLPHLTESRPHSDAGATAPQTGERRIRIVFADSAGQRLKLDVRHVLIAPDGYMRLKGGVQTLESLLDGVPAAFVDEVSVVLGQQVHFVFGLDEHRYKVTADHHTGVPPRLRRPSIGLLNLNGIPVHVEEHVVPVLTQHELAVVVQYADGEPFRGAVRVGLFDGTRMASTGFEEVSGEGTFLIPVSEGLEVQVVAPSRRAGFKASSRWRIPAEPSAEDMVLTIQPDPSRREPCGFLVDHSVLGPEEEAWCRVITRHSGATNFTVKGPGVTASPECSARPVRLCAEFGDSTFCTDLLTLSPGEWRTVVLVRSPSAAVHGLIVDTEGKPVANSAAVPDVVSGFDQSQVQPSSVPSTGPQFGRLGVAWTGVSH